MLGGVGAERANRLRAAQSSRQSGSIGIEIP